MSVWQGIKLTYCGKGDTGKQVSTNLSTPPLSPALIGETRLPLTPVPRQNGGV